MNKRSQISLSFAIIYSVKFLKMRLLFFDSATHDNQKWVKKN